MQSTAGEPSTPELVFALIAPVGTPSAKVIGELEKALYSYSYAQRVIKLSQCLKEAASDLKLTLVEEPENARVESYMNAGNEVCANAQTTSEVVRLGIEEMMAVRLQSAAGEAQSNDAWSAPLVRTAWVIDSLKRPGEVTALREIYGDHLLVIAVQASRETRVRSLKERIRPQAASINDTELTAAVARLLQRDLTDPAQGDFGQNIVSTFPLADVFIDADAEIAPQITRFVDLLFGNPEHSGPTDAEHGMQLAFLASTMSLELGLKVGAAIMADGSVISLGANAHPTAAQQSPAFDRSKLEIQRLVLDTIQRLADGGMISDSTMQAMEKDPDTWTRDVLRTTLKGSAVTSLTEFQPTVHAEMAAVLEAVKNGRGVDDARIFVTAYPCHGCTKHLLRLGLDVTYLEPYPKSLAEAMYGSDVSNFAPFTGIAPRRYNQLFATTEDRKGPDGARIKWEHAERSKAIPNVDPLVDHAGVLGRESLLVEGIHPPVGKAERECEISSENQA